MWTALVRKDGKPWALYKTINKAGGSQQQPADDKCQECFELHTEAFPHLGWSELCESNASDGAMTKTVAAARVVKNGSSKAPPIPEEVDNQTEVSVEIRKRYIVLSESELQKPCKKLRSNKAFTSTLAAGTVTTEDGSSD